jgi:hypothetical protein
MMSPDQCETRAVACTAKAAKCPPGIVATDYLTLAAQWRAMGVHSMYFAQRPAAALD